jgi:REP element-mobilizing transposase RayT
MLTDRPRRLAGVSYVGYQRYSLTFCTAFRRRTFQSEDVITSVLEQLRQTCSLCEFALTAYCVMHDHLHVLATGQSERADLRDFVKRFKQATGFAYRKAHRQTLWQPGYHERILRDDEATEAVVRYILANPIRAGLTKEIGEYAFAGSDAYELAGLLTAWDKQT